MSKPKLTNELLLDTGKVIEELKKYFDIRELVGKRTYKKHGNRSWKFFSHKLLVTLLVARVELDKPITINTWYKGGKFSQRGLRTNVQDIFRGFFRKGRLYLSAHVLGEAVDFDVKGMTASEVRKWIKENEHLFPYKLRLEAGVNWVHLDVLYEWLNPKVYIFNP